MADMDGYEDEGKRLQEDKAYREYRAAIVAQYAVTRRHFENGRDVYDGSTPKEVYDRTYQRKVYEFKNGFGDPVF